MRSVRQKSHHDRRNRNNLRSPDNLLIKRQEEAKDRQIKYDALSLDQKIAAQSSFKGKEWRKLVAKKDQAKK